MRRRGGRSNSGMATSQIKFLDFRVGFDFLRIALLEDGAVVHHRDGFNDPQRHIHVVLDDDVADMGRQRGQDLDQLGALGRRQAGGGLVEQDEARRAGQGQRDFKLALLAVD